MDSRESKAILSEPEYITQDIKKVNFFFSNRTLNISEKIYFACPVSHDDIIVCTRDFLQLVNLKENTIKTSKLYGAAHTGKILYIPLLNQIILYGIPDVPTLMISAKTLEKTNSYSHKFLELHLITDSRLIGRTSDKPKKLQIFNLHKLDREPVTSCDIKENTQWTVANGFIVKVPEDKNGRVKIMAFANDGIGKETEFFYDHPWNAKDIRISHVVQHANTNYVSFRITSPSQKKYNTVLIDVKDKRIVRNFGKDQDAKEVGPIESLVKMPDENAFLLIEAPDTSHGHVVIKGNVHFWMVGTGYRGLFEKFQLSDLSMTANTQKGATLYLANGKVNIIQTAHFSFKHDLLKEKKKEAQPSVGLFKSLSAAQEAAEARQDEIEHMKFEFK